MKTKLFKRGYANQRTHVFRTVDDQVGKNDHRAASVKNNFESK